MTRLLTIKDGLDWASYVDQSAENDFYHTWHYHSLDKSGAPILFVYEEAEDFIAVPFIRRQIPGSIYSDLTCVYGYSGPLANKKMDAIDLAFADNFKRAFLEFLSEENFVSVFLRMNPFYNQDLLLNRFGGVHENGEVVVIDLTTSMEEQQKKYSRSTLADIKKAVKKGYYIKEEQGPDAIKVFKEIYEENMRRIGASDSYLFNDNHYLEMLSNAEYDARLFMAYKAETVACSTIVIFKNKIIQSYLIGTRMEYLRESPAKFLVDGVSQIGRQDGMHYYNLGGGLGFQQDSLLDWKKAFSNHLLGYRSWRYIANPDVYQQLLDQKGIDKNNQVDFFPLYRLT